MRTLKLKKEVVATLTGEQSGRVRGGGILDPDTFESRCQCGSLRNCPEPPVDTYACGTVNCVSCGCATYEANCTNSYIICGVSDLNAQCHVATEVANVGDASCTISVAN